MGDGDGEGLGNETKDNEEWRREKEGRDILVEDDGLFFGNIEGHALFGLCLGRRGHVVVNGRLWEWKELESGKWKELEGV